MYNITDSAKSDERGDRAARGYEPPLRRGEPFPVVRRAEPAGEVRDPRSDAVGLVRRALHELSRDRTDGAGKLVLRGC